jgi:peptidoglycan lytic transglycosylase
MRIRRPATVLVAALLAPAVLACAAAAATADGAASSGGAAPGVLVLPGPPQVTVRIGDPLARASGAGLTISARTTAVVRGRTHVAGSVARRGTTTVRIEQLDPQGGWTTVASATVRRDRTFDAYWRPRHSGLTRLRALPGGAGAAGAAASAPQVAVAVYRRGVASWYGPGDYGKRTACGVALSATTLGVAHRTLPCGTPVALTYRGRMLVVPVIDRGPFTPGRTWDLTQATFQALGGGDAGLIRLGALALTSGTPPQLP